MKARLVLPPGMDRTPEWHTARLVGVTASEVAALLGLSPYESPYSLYWRKLGALPQIRDNDSMSLGRTLEPWVADRFAEAHPHFHVRDAGLWQSTERPYQLATPDRLVHESPNSVAPVAVWEGKTSATYEGWGEAGTDEIPVHYRAQVLWQLDTLGLTEGYVSCLFLHSKQVRHYLVTYDERDVKLLRDAATNFVDRLNRKDAPPIDDAAATARALQSLWPAVDQDDEPEVEVPESLADHYERARRDLADAESRRDACENQLREILGDGKRAVAGDRKVCSRSVFPRKDIDRERLKRDYPDVYAACLVESTVDRLNPARLSKEP
ncbi:lambda-exonuclease family protein [Sphaerisporangium sp. TRM90804]|uniref:YqaJ viral recombinase family nuclease n=1 Tax=Sphaerisporangium sp. TRM90804 TaxID=3031113 RepID=UPI0024470839|nr:YqaJ viral recombinase family protein [Sphaerisporangium sp. TRM90804]MDH2424846.1 YqaJ viral recombinase family protein [Sphaerisporangium sp. TRM90804]